MCFEASLPGLRKQRRGGGGWGGGGGGGGWGVGLGGGRSPPPPPPICKHNARIIGLEKIFIRCLPGFKQQRGV